MMDQADYPFNVQPFRMFIGRTAVMHVDMTAADGSALPIARVRVRVKESPSDETAIIEKDSQTNSTDIVFTDGSADITFNPSDTTNLEVRQYIYDVVVWATVGSEHEIISPSPFFLDQTL